jgi:hypothetical protein
MIRELVVVKVDLKVEFLADSLGDTLVAQMEAWMVVCLADCSDV